FEIRIDETIELNGARVVLQSLRIENNEARLYAYWNHHSRYEKAHLDLLVTTVFKQNDENLDITQGEDKFLRQRSAGIDGGLDLKLKLIDDSPITIKFIETTDEMESKEITV